MKQQAQKFGFDNDEFLKKTLPELEKKFGPAYNKFNNESKIIGNTGSFSSGSEAINNSDLNDLLDIPPIPESFPSSLQPKVIKYDTKSISNKYNKSSGGLNDPSKKGNKSKGRNGNLIPVQDFAPLKRIQSESVENSKNLKSESKNKSLNSSKVLNNTKSDCIFIENISMNEIIATKTTTYKIPNVRHLL